MITKVITFENSSKTEEKNLTLYSTLENFFLLISIPILNDEYIDWSKLTEQKRFEHRVLPVTIWVDN